MGSRYFRDLNYSLANEDTGIELELLPENSGRVLVIPSSGAQALPLLAKNPQFLHIVDISRPQLFLTELRIAALRALDYEEWLYFIGYRQVGRGRDRREIFSLLSLTGECRAYWERDLFWTSEGVLWLGRWEKFFRRLGSWARPLFFKDFEKFFQADNLAAQREIYQKHWPHKRFRFFLQVASSPGFMNRWLYRGDYAGSAEKTARHIEERYRSIFLHHCSRKNFFMQMLFLGRIEHEEAFPVEAQRDVFERAKRAETRIEYSHESLTAAISRAPYDFYHFSDVLSYLPAREANSILARMHADVPAGSLVVARLFNRGPKELSHESWKQETELMTWAQKTDQTAVYDFRIARKL